MDVLLGVDQHRAPSPPPQSAQSAAASSERLSDELHQSLGDTLHLLGRHLDRLSAADGSGESAARVRMLRGHVDDALATLRDVLERLDLVRFGRLRLDKAIRGLAAEFMHTTGTCVDVRVRGSVADLAGALRLEALRVVRGALFDIVRQGRASVVVVAVSAGPTRVAVDVMDDGIDVARRRVPDWRSPAPELAVAAMARDVGAAGGRFVVVQGRPRGLRLRVVLPRDAGAAS